MPFLLALVVTILIGVGVRMKPYFAGDVAVAQIVQAMPDPDWWATPVSRLPTAPAKHYVMAMTVAVAFVLAGWRGAVLAIVILALEQYGAESTKAIFQRPRPSSSLINVIGSPSGYSFPSTTMTFLATTFGLMAVLAGRAQKNPISLPVLGLASCMLIAGAFARVALGAHWPSDVVLTVVICLAWIWALARTVLRRAS